MYSRTAKKGLEAALKYYLEHGTEYVCLVTGNKPDAKYKNCAYANWNGKIEDINDVAELIKQKFEDTEISKDIFCLMWWDEKPVLKDGKPVNPASDSVLFMTATDEDIQARQANYQANIGYINNQIISRLSAIEEKLNSEEEEAEEEKPEQLNGIGAVLANPAFSAGITTLVTRLLDNYLPEKKAVTALAGTGESEAEKLNIAIARLQAVNPKLADDLLLLADLAESNPTQFNWLLNMLRK